MISTAAHGTSDGVRKAGIVQHLLLVSRAHNADTATCDIAETEVETAELVADDEEHAKRLFGVLHLGKEVRCETEREGDLRRLVEVCLQDSPSQTINKRGSP